MCLSYRVCISPVDTIISRQQCRFIRDVVALGGHLRQGSTFATEKYFIVRQLHPCDARKLTNLPWGNCDWSSLSAIAYSFHHRQGGSNDCKQLLKTCVDWANAYPADVTSSEFMMEIADCRDLLHVLKSSCTPPNMLVELLRFITSFGNLDVFPNLATMFADTAYHWRIGC